jgi:hypothetical protein
MPVVVAVELMLPELRLPAVQEVEEPEEKTELQQQLLEP